MVIVLEGLSMSPERANLLVAMLVALPLDAPLFIGKIVHCVIAHKYSSLLGIVTRGAYQHHCGNPARLLCSHVQQCITPAAQTNRLELVDTQVVEQGKHIKRSLSKGESHGWIG